MVAIGFQCSFSIPLKRIIIILHCFTLSLTPSHSPLLLNSAQWVLLTWNLTWVTQARSNRNGSLSINQDVNLLFFFTLAPLLSFSRSLRSFSYLSLLTPLPSSVFSFFFHCLSLSPSLSVCVAWSALFLFNCHGLHRIEEDETGMGLVGQCRERYNEGGRGEWLTEDAHVFTVVSGTVA